ncbi:GNAT family N-acetyltransferase [Desulfobulbus oligotrophicus]|uniref:GNAT family N-acetyltransferase n=1 Tax=Desulfobulbus oligotrophicus TaxID=1909699 RepID=A0A7T5VBA6_9BACT|nr:GNAT family N-acetyltransferase [Desulfobulbus oligotrophicus]QQG64711.1 GNAT family N-acetyltransferase [Desulfobulbus oligotrophicus]
MNTSFHVITSKEELTECKEEWTDLYHRVDIRSFFVSFEYVRMWYTHFAAPDAVRIYTVRAEEKLIGLLPLVLRHHSGGVRELSNLVNDHSLIAPPLIAVEYTEVVQQTLLNALVATKTDWDIFTHSFSYSFCRMPHLFTESRLAGCGCLWKNVTEPTYAIFLKGTFAEYFTQVLSRNLRKNLKNAANRLNREKNVRYFLLRDEEVLTFWPKFLELEASGWKGQSRTAIACTDTAIQQYYLDLIRLMSTTDQIYLYGLEIDGVLVAGEFGYVDKDIFHHAKVAYNEQFAHLSPSHLLMLHILEDLPVHFPQVRLFHMFPWDTGYKQRFVDEPSFYTTTTLYSSTWRGRTLYALRWLKDQMKEQMPGVVGGVKKAMAAIRPTGN